MWKRFKMKVVASLLACACVFAGAGFGVAVKGASAETSGDDNPSVTDVTAPFTQGSLGDSYSQTLVVSQGNSLARATALRMTEGENGAAFVPMMEVISNNVSYSDSVYIIYAVKTNGNYPVQMLFWEELPEAYEKGTESYATTVRRLDTVRGEECKLFYSNGIPAKKMTDTIYSCTYTVVDGVEYYGEPLKYSVVDYVYTVREGGVKERIDKLLTQMLEYGAAAQENFAYHTERLATGNFYKVQVVGGTIADGFTYGRYIENSTITLSAPAVNADGRPFVRWKNSKGEEVITKNTFALSVFEDETYTAVYADDFTYELSADGIAYTITGCLNARNEINIPATYNGVKVRYIADRAFQNQTKIKSVSIPDGVVGIGANAFDGCTALTKVNVPASVRSIGNYAFYGCNALQEINVNANNAIYESLGGVLYSKGLAMLIQYPLGLTAEEFYVPSATTSIAGSAFRNGKTLQRVYIGEQVTFVGASAFKNCGTLTVYCSAESQPEGWDVNWNDGCEVVCGYKDPAFGSVFEYTSDGESITITKYVGDSSEVVIPSKIDGLPVKKIGERAFYNCSSLTSVVIPNSVTSIGVGTFYGCSSLTSVVIPESVTSIGMAAFGKCSSLTSVVIPDSVTSIAGYTFEYCIGLTSVVIPNSVTSIGMDEFRECSSLTSVVIPDSVTSIGNSAFSGCSSLTSVVIPDSVTSIGNSAFYRCSSLTICCEATSKPSGWDSNWNYSNRPVVWGYAGAENGIVYSLNDDGTGYTVAGIFECIEADLVIPATFNSLPVTAIRSNAFKNCSSLTSVVIPDSVTSIGDDAFEGCSSLTSVEIPDSVTSIGDYAFSGCSKLTSVVIGEEVMSIGCGAFVDCSSLASVTFKNPYGWWCANYKSDTTGPTISSTNLSNASIARTYLKDSYKYYYWRRSE